MSMSPIEKAVQEMFAHYGRLIESARASEEDAWEDEPRLSLKNLAWMCQEGGAGCGVLPLDKMNRWLGFVQGCLCMRGLVDVDIERAVSRPLFHSAYQEMGTPIPETLEQA